MAMMYTTPAQSLKIMLRVIFALILRETKTRYGNLRIGYLWAFIEPLLFITILSIIFSYGRSRNSFGMPDILFFTTGLLPFFLFRDIANTGIAAVKQNIQLLYYPQVQVFDLNLARALLEFCTFVIVFTTYVTIIWLAQIEPVSVDDFLQLAFAIVLIFLYGFGLGAAIGALSWVFPTMEFIGRTLLIQPMFFISGVFFPADIVPDEIRPLLLLNPMLQLLETVRSAFFHEFESTHVNFGYLIPAVLIMLCLGLLLQRALRRHAVSQRL